MPKFVYIMKLLYLQTRHFRLKTNCSYVKKKKKINGKHFWTISEITRNILQSIIQPIRKTITSKLLQFQ